MRIKLHADSHYGDFFTSSENWALCRDALTSHIELPNDVRRIDIVATERPRADSFKMTGYFGGDEAQPVLIDVGEYLLEPLRSYLKRAYRAGNRYVHVEHD